MDNQKNNQKNKLYYSKISKLCTDLIKIMDSCGATRMFAMHCVDDMPVIPQGIDKVPTLMIYDIQKVLIGKEALVWFSENRIYYAQKNAELQGKKIIYNNTIGENNTGPKAFSNTEDNGMSDTFAYTDVDAPQPKAFCPNINGEHNDTDIYTPPEDYKKNENHVNNMKKKITSMRNERRTQESQYSEQMKKDQINKILSIEQEKLLKTSRYGI